MKHPKSKPSLYEIIYAGVKRIPRGKVATYGEVARTCGLREHARLVGYALHNLRPNSGVPWHRVINSKGEISLPRGTGAYERQRILLEGEGVEFTNDRIDLRRFGVTSAAANDRAQRLRSRKTKVKRRNRDRG